MTLVKEYLEYTKHYKVIYGTKTLVLMEVGSFYECYAIKKAEGVYEGSDILDFTQINDMIIANKNTCVDEQNIVMAGFGVTQLDKYVRKMLLHGYTIVVYIQDKQASKTTRSLGCIYSPGTYFDNNDYYSQGGANESLSNNTMCIWIHYSKKNRIVKEETITIGLTLIDIITGKLVSYEYTINYSNSPTTYDQLEKYISIYNPCELIIITNKNSQNGQNSENSHFIDDVISYANINSAKIHKVYLLEDEDTNTNTNTTITSFETIAQNCEKQLYQETLIDKIYGAGSYRGKSEFQNYSVANQSLCFLLVFIEKHNPSLIKAIDYPHFENINNQLILANHSLKQLNIISDQRYNGKLGCVANFLNNTITNAGRRKFAYDLLHPINNIASLNASYDVTQELIDTKFYKIISHYLLNVRDIEKFERKLNMYKLDPKDFGTLYANLSNISILYEKIRTSKSNSLLYSYISSLVNCDICSSISYLNNYIEKVFDLNKLAAITCDKFVSYSLYELDFINKTYNKKLDKLFKNCFDSQEQLDAIVKFLCELLRDYEKQKTGPSASVTTKSAKAKNTKKTLVNKDGDDDDDEVTCVQNSDLLANPKTNNELGESTASSLAYNYVKIHETAKSDALLIITKRRSLLLKTLISNLIAKSGPKYSICYNSKYSKTNEIIELDLTLIDFKSHGSNNSNNVIVSSQISTLTHSIQNSRDWLIEELCATYKTIIGEFNNLTVSFYKTKNNALENTNTNKNTSLLGSISQFVALSDVCYVKAYNALKYNYCKPHIANDPTLKTKSYVSFKKLRHCLIEHLNAHELYVTNDLELGTSRHGILLYGTNAVGKTSFIKSIGIAIIMAQAGMYVPCEEFTYYPYEYLFTRILGNDNIFKGLSTFAVEMCELRTIMKNANSNSIILGDELCSGTETTSALSIFVASLERLHALQSTFLFATHFHEILEYEEIKSLDKLDAYHMCVLFDREKNTLIYDRKLRHGHGESMYGLEVCKSLALPDDFIERAYAIRNKYNKTHSSASVIEAKKSHYNANKLRGMCELCCDNEGTEIHHLQYQKNAKNGIINGEFNKNHKANLINICEACHHKIHNLNSEFRITKTSDGYKLLPL
jgi:DNA mismatch repair protein MutS|uniref:DNA mismatch repair proteins mutS family domain-containing protein n=1 Tax=viral metagenome TaxID=1070528 RepID=A0A6C0CDN9_9ZZZZ